MIGVSQVPFGSTGRWYYEVDLGRERKMWRSSEKCDGEAFRPFASRFFVTLLFRDWPNDNRMPRQASTLSLHIAAARGPI